MFKLSIPLNSREGALELLTLLEWAKTWNFIKSRQEVCYHSILADANKIWQMSYYASFWEHNR